MVIRESNTNLDCIAFTSYRGSCVLIAPNVILSIQHVPSGCHAQNPYYARFRRAPDCTIGSFDCPPELPGGGADSFHDVRIRCWAYPIDLAWEATDPVLIGFLEEPVLHIRPIPIEVDPGDVVSELPLSIAGWGGTSTDFGNLKSAETSLFAVFNPDFAVLESGSGFPSGQLRDSGGPWIAETGPGDSLRVVAVFRSGTTGPPLYPYVTSGATFNVLTTSQTCGDPEIARWNFNCPECIYDEDFELPEYVECPGDANRDNVVDVLDLNMVLGNFGTGCIGDVNYSLNVDIQDMNMVLGNFNTTCTVPGTLDFAACESESAMQGEGGEQQENAEFLELPIMAVLDDLGWHDLEEYSMWVTGLGPADQEAHSYELLATYWKLFGVPE